jgi:NADPH:quinone reductase-like Zn-dependent oxidoreductase
MTQTQAIRIHEFGGPDVLKQESVELPQPKSQEVLVRIMAASVNPVDTKTRQGKFQAIKVDDLPLTLGRDLSGVVENCGADTNGIRKGDAVFALLGSERGAYAQFAMVRLDELAPKPENLSHVEAAAVPLAALTAWQGMIDHGALEAGQRVLIHGAAGGVGHFAVQIAKARGAWVAATCSGRDLDFVRSLGADQVIDHEKQKFENDVNDIDLVFDLVAGETQDRSFSVLKDGGALISTLKEPDAQKAAAKDLRVAHYMTESDGGELNQIGALLLEGKIKPFIFATFPLSEAARAEILLDKSHVQGKVVLTVAQDKAA